MHNLLHQIKIDANVHNLQKETLNDY